MRSGGILRRYERQKKRYENGWRLNKSFRSSRDQNDCFAAGGRKAFVKIERLGGKRDFF